MRSAWIEIQQKALIVGANRRSRSMRSAWIEMTLGGVISAAGVVALHAERVD